MTNNKSDDILFSNSNLKVILPRRKKVLYFLLTLIFSFLALASWAFASPVGSSPDEDFHLASIWCAYESDGFCESTAGEAKKVPFQIIESICFAKDEKTSAACQESMFQNGSERLLETSRGNFSTNYYPGIYYSFQHMFVSQDIELSVITMRLCNIFIFVLSSTIAWFLLTKKDKKYLLIGWFSIMIPLGAFTVASVNPSSWTITGTGIAFLSIVGLTQHASKLRTSGFWALLISAAILTLGARSDGAIYFAIACATGFLIRTRLNFKKILLILLPIFAVSALVFLASHGLETALYGFGTNNSDSARSAVSVFANNIFSFPSLYLGSFGYWPLGWIDTRLPELVWVSITVSVSGLMFAKISKLSKKQLIILSLVTFISVATPLYLLQKSMSFVGEEIQPRYLLPFLVIIIFLILFSNSNENFTLTNAQAFIFVSLIVSANAVSLYFNESRYIQGVGNGGNANLNLSASHGGWWWVAGPSPMTNLLIGSISFGMIGIVIFWLLAKQKINEVVASSQ